MSDDDGDRLRAENERLKADIAKRDAELTAQKEAIAKLRHYLWRLLQGRFGRSTEKLLGITPADQTLITEIVAFIDSEDAAPVDIPVPTAAPIAAVEDPPTQPAEPTTEAVPAGKPAKRGSRQRPSVTYPQLEVRETSADLPESQRIDGDGRPLVRCGEHVVETIVFSQPEVFIERVVHPRYRSATEIDAEGRATTAGVPAPERIVDGGILADQTVHAIVISKFADALPANRTLEIMARAGCRLSGSVVDGAVAAMGDLLAPLADEIRADLRSSPVVGVDAAIMRCRDSDRRDCRRTPIYTITDGTQAWYHWAPDEEHRHGSDVIHGFHRWLITDGWAGWRRSTSIGARLAGCWAHARRPFARMEKDPDALRMLRLIHDLYAVEWQADAVGASLAERRRLRQARSRPIIDAIRAFALDLDRLHPGAGGHPCGRGARYILNQWFDLNRFIDHPELRLDNNLAEGDLRMVALIRKNSLFLGAASAGPRAAACLSIVRSCRLARINPSDYLVDVAPILIRWRRCRRAGLPTTDLAGLTPKRWGAERRTQIRSAS